MTDAEKALHAKVGALPAAAEAVRRQLKGRAALAAVGQRLVKWVADGEVRMVKAVVVGALVGRQRHPF